MIRLGLVGYPLDHSLSPVLHQVALKVNGLQGEYALYSVHPTSQNTLPDLVGSVRSGEIHGLNITIPYKQAITRHLDGLTPAASAIGAVNTVYSRDGRAVGDNTDFAGFLADLQAWGSNPRSSIVLGTGGAARAVVYALRQMGCRMTLASRRLDKARELAEQFPDVTAIPLTDEALRGLDPDLLINATPAGMFPDVDGCAWPERLPLPQTAAIYDLVYNPPETRLIQRARMEGLRARNGLGMLIEQAALAFEIWTGCKVPRSTLEKAIGQKVG